MKLFLDGALSGRPLRRAFLGFGCLAEFYEFQSAVYRDVFRGVAFAEGGIGFAVGHIRAVAAVFQHDHLAGFGVGADFLEGFGLAGLAASGFGLSEDGLAFF